MDDVQGLALALEEARIGYNEGGIPVGAVLVSRHGTVLGRGRNMRIQSGSPILHGETSAFHDSAGQPRDAYEGATMYTTLSPCDMCTGACLLYGLARVVIGENKTMLGGEEYLRTRGVEIVVMDSAECKELMDRFIKENPDVWWV